MMTAAFLQGELERLFELESMLELSEAWLGVAPGDVGSTDAKGAFARALVDHCARIGALPALAEAIRLAGRGPVRVESHEPDSAPSEGSLVGGYQLVEYLGRGNLGRVFLGERSDPEAGGTRQVAIKLYDQVVAQNRAAVLRTLPHARALAQVRGSGLAAIVEAGTLPDGRLFVVSELVRGRSLAQELKRVGRIPFDALRGIARGWLAGLSALHARGLVHGHLTPTSAFLVDDMADETSGVLGELLTFRLLQGAEPSVPGVQRVVGDPSTIAPEVACGAEPDARSDVYSLGCLLYEALTGRPPFVAQSPLETIALRLFGHAVPPSQVAGDGSIPPILDGVILHALQRRPEDRFETAKDFADELESLGQSIFPPAPRDEGWREALQAALERFEAAPEDPQTSEDLEAVASPARAWEPVVDAYADQAGMASEPAVKKRLWFRAARILAHELKDREAAETAYERVLEIDPSDAQARDAVEELYRRGGRHEQLVATLLDRLDTETDPATRAKVLREVGDLYDTHLYQPENAVVAFAQALAEQADDERTERTVHRLASAERAFADVEAILAAAAEDSERPENALAAHVALARVQRSGLGQREQAHATLTRALGLDPAYEPALNALTELYRETEQYPQLVELLVHRADAASSAARARELRVEAAHLLLDQLGDSERAEKLLSTVFTADPSHEGVGELLEDLYRARGDIPQALQVLERHARTQKPVERAGTLMRIAALHEQSEDGTERALESYRAALALDDGNVDAVDGLVRILTDREEYAAVVPLLEQKLGLVKDTGLRVDILDSLGTIHEALEQRAEATQAFERVLELAPEHADASAALTRLYRSTSRFEELAALLDRQAKATNEPEHKAALLMQAARVWMVDVGSPERALFVCERVLAVAPHHPEALALTSRMRALSGDTASALEALEVLADGETDPAKKAEVLVRVAELDEQREDLDRAIGHYLRALDFERGHTRAIESLRRLYERRGDLAELSALLQRSADAVSDPAERVRLLIELGNFRFARLNDRALAQRAFEDALAIDPDALEASAGVGRLALAQGEHATAIELLEPLRERLGELPQAAARDACMALGDAYRARGQLQLGQEAYLSAKAVTPHDRGVLGRLSEVAIETGSFEEATHTLGELLDRYGAQLGKDERADALLKLGLAHQSLEELGKAGVALSQALDLRPDHEPTASALLAVYEAQKNSTQVLTLIERCLAGAPSAERRYELLVKRGDVYAQQLRDRDQAARAYLGALELAEADRNVLAKLMAVYSEDEDWGKLCDVLVRLAGVVESPELRAKYLSAAASVAASRLQHPERAAELYERALDEQHDHAGAFQGLHDCLSRTSDWSRLVSATRTYLERNAEKLGAERVAGLWDEVASICETRLDRLDEAVQAYEEAQAALPEDRARMERLADLYGRHPNRYGQLAVTVHEELLAQNPYRVESYRALRKLYTQLKRPDEAWVVCQALRGLNMAEPEEETFFKRHRVRAPATALECFSDEIWQDYLVHDDQDDLLTSIFALVQPAAVLENARPLEALGLGAGQQINCAEDGSVMGQMLFYASGVSLVPLPPVFYREHDTGGISFVLSHQAGLGLGPAAFQKTPDQALAFIAGRQLSYFRPGHLMRQLAPSGSALRGWLLAAIRVANPRFPVPEALEATVDQHQGSLSRTLQRPQEQALQSLIERLLRDHPEVDTKRWGLGVDYTADRLGFVLANSLDAAVAVVRASPADASFASERDRLKALYRYAVSTRYIGLRRATGITLG
jgi:tetratricopeptide (TPR) repeat protein